MEPFTTTALDVNNPATESAITSIRLGGAADVDRAVAAAKRAFAGFSIISKAERKAMLELIATILERRNNEIVEIISQDLGAPLAMAKSSQAPQGVAHFRQTIKAMEDFDFEYMQGTTRVMQEPIGVVAMITPWNWPFNQIAAKVAPALATGCTIILKPSELAPLNAILFAEVLDEAGVPPGVFNLVHGDGPTVGAALARHADVDMISFTGSTRAGISGAQMAAETVKRVHQELGGKSPNIILRSANLEEAVKAGVSRCFNNSGQSCNAPTRMLVPVEMLDAAMTFAAEAAADTIAGPPQDADTVIGPVISKAQFDKIDGMIRTAIDEGAQLVAGGAGRPEGLTTGYYVRPTVFAHVTNDMAIARDEVFGPVLAMIAYDSLEEAVEIANDTAYGLAAYIQGDPTEARLLSRKLRTGSVRINSPAWDGAAPFGGYKQSGNGREYGKFGLQEFTEVKAVIGYDS